jgi:hypothetical protein
MDPPRQDLKVGDLVNGNPISMIDEYDGQVCVVDLRGIKALADVIPGMGALTSFTFGDKQCRLYCCGMGALTMTTEMTEADFSWKLEPHEAQIVAAFLPKCT